MYWLLTIKERTIGSQKKILGDCSLERLYNFFFFFVIICFEIIIVVYRSEILYCSVYFLVDFGDGLVTNSMLIIDVIHNS